MPTGTRPQPPVDSVRVAIKGTYLTHPVVNVFWLGFTVSGARVVNDLASIIDSLVASWGTRFNGIRANEAVDLQAQAVWLTGVGSELTYTKAMTSGGTHGAGIKDAAGCYLINWGIGAYYRGGHPRTYMAAPIDGAMTNGSSIYAPDVATLATAAAGFKSDVDALTHGNITAVSLGTVSFQRAKEWRTPPVFEPYISSSVSPTLATQRRRIGR
jgi:hypothetical protein